MLHGCQDSASGSISIVLEVEPLRRVFAQEILHGIRQALRAGVEFPGRRRARQSHRRIRHDHVAAMSRASGKNGNHGRSGEGRQAQRALRHLPGGVEHRHGTRAQTVRQAVDLKRYTSATLQVPDQRQSGERIVTNVDDQQSVRATRFVLDTSGAPHCVQAPRQSSSVGRGRATGVARPSPIPPCARSRR